VEEVAAGEAGEVELERGRSAGARDGAV